MTPTKPTFKEALQFWLKLGFISFGGPAGQIAIMHNFLVEKKCWISDGKFLHALNYCMLLPGPEAQQLATYIGWLMHGLKGGLVAGILFVLPSTFILLSLSLIYVTFGQLASVSAVFSGLKPAVVAIVIGALIKIGKKSLSGWSHHFVALASFICIFFLKVPFPFIIGGAIIGGFVWQWLFPQLFIAKKVEKKQDWEETDYYLNLLSPIAGSGVHGLRIMKQIVTGALFWGIPLGLFFCIASHFLFWKTLVLFFTKAALVTFGGAYAVLPYVAQKSVETYHWLSAGQMIDGLALGETTPGPLIMVLAFVGFMAGYHTYAGALWAGTAGLLTTTFYTFLPSFLFIFIGAPLVEKTQENPVVKRILGIVTAAVVGVVLNLTLYLGEAVIWPQGWSLNSPDWLSLGWIIISFIGLQFFKINMIWWIGISGTMGFIWHLATQILGF